MALLKKVSTVKKVRLIGTGVSRLSFGTAERQLTLFQPADSREQQWERVASSVDAIADKFGKQMVEKGTLIE